ncbi:uncharacterized protein [Arachis hypogaea]|uniref:uncharacterized protein n=1 Tax=Arachis hypogaea TaxID=3818 RepID=UPI000DEC68C3
MSAEIRSRGDIVLNVASSGIASLLLPNGRTAHSRFKIPLNITEDSVCNIKPGSPQAMLLLKAKLIIWDEAPMVSRYCYETLDKCLGDIMRYSPTYSKDLPFGGKVVVLGGDFRQILPIIPRGSRQDIVHSTVNSSYLWKFCQVLKLTKNMRLSIGTTASDQDEIEQFGEWLLKVSDGLIGDNMDGESEICLPGDIIIPSSDQAFDELVHFSYPNILENMSSKDFFKARTILAPTLDIVEEVNNHLMAIIPGGKKLYLSSDSICMDEGNMESQLDLYDPELLNSINCSSLPPHKSILKVGVPVMLLRNIDQSSGLCNGTRLQVRKLGNHVIECEVLTGNIVGHIALIPRMNMVPTNEIVPVRFQRRQFPIIVSFAMTINKFQGQTLSHVGLYLPRPVFTHGQLYVALSRVKTLNGGHLSCLSCSLAFYQIQNLKHQFFSLSQRGAFYLREIPLAATLAFWVKLRGRGLWIGIHIGAFVQTLLLSIITSCIDWEQKVINARKRQFERHSSEDNGLIREDNDENSI